MDVITHHPVRSDALTYADRLVTEGYLSAEQACLPNEPRLRDRWQEQVAKVQQDRTLSADIKALWRDHTIATLLEEGMLANALITHLTARLISQGCKLLPEALARHSYEECPQHAVDECVSARTTQRLCTLFKQEGLPPHHWYGLLSGLAQQGRAMGAYKKLDPQILLLPAIRDMRLLEGASETDLKAVKMLALLEVAERQFASAPAISKTTTR